MGGVIFDYLSKVLPPGPKASKNIGAGLQSSFISFFLKKETIIVSRALRARFVLRSHALFTQSY